MFGFGKKKEVIICSPMDGELVPISEVNDPTFGEGILGPGVAIKPSSGRVVAPADATVGMMFETGHAVSLVAGKGVELLIHVGLDTVQLKGEHYTKRVADGEKVNIGDVLMEFDAAAIKNAGYDIITPVVVCNSDDFKEICFADAGPIKEGEPLITVRLN